jgi:hypothetical protein
MSDHTVVPLMLGKGKSWLFQEAHLLLSTPHEVTSLVKAVRRKFDFLTPNSVLTLEIS